VKTIATIIQACLISALLSVGAATLEAASNDTLGQPMRLLTVANGEAADLVVVDAGSQQGIEPGMVLQVTHLGESRGELLVTRTGQKCSVALILEINDTQAMAAGDMAILKRKTI